MRFYIFSILMLGIVVLLFLYIKPSFVKPSLDCPVNMVKVGPVCVDKYEASVWSQPPDGKGNPQGTQYGLVISPGSFIDYPCSDNGNDCSKAGTKIFAVSAPGVKPSGFISWFQAQQACANVGKRLLRSGEWQMAAAGTPDPGTDNGTTDCNITGPFLAPADPVPPGSRSNCISNFGVFDMVGNMAEWVEDWVPLSTTCHNPLYNDDLNCMAGASTTSTDFGPGALIRDCWAGCGISSGVFAITARISPGSLAAEIGFRCAR